MVQSSAVLGGQWWRENKAALGGAALCSAVGALKGVPMEQGVRTGGGRRLRAPRFKFITWAEPDCSIMGILLIAF